MPIFMISSSFVVIALNLGLEPLTNTRNDNKTIHKYLTIYDHCGNVSTSLIPGLYMILRRPYLTSVKEDSG